MAKLENIVRPVVLPNIRPPARVRSIDEEDSDVEYVIRGGSGGFIDLSFNFSLSSSQNRPTEEKRKVDEVRFYQKDDSGTVNRENFIDMQVAKKIWLRTGAASGGVNNAAGGGTPAGGSIDIKEPWYFTEVQEADNIEIKKADVIVKNPRA